MYENYVEADIYMECAIEKMANATKRGRKSGGGEQKNCQVFKLLALFCALCSTRSISILLRLIMYARERKNKLSWPLARLSHHKTYIKKPLQ